MKISIKKMKILYIFFVFFWKFLPVKHELIFVFSNVSFGLNFLARNGFKRVLRVIKRPLTHC